MALLNQLMRGSGFGAVIGVAVMLIAFTLIDFSGWWSVRTLSNVVHFTSILAIIAMGQALVIISKEIDLSVGSVYGLTGVAFITLQPALGVPGATLVALVIAALFNPVRQQTQTLVDRRFYRSKYNAALTLARFSQIARDEVELDRLTAELLQVSAKTMQPSHISFWLKPDLEK